MNFTRSAVLGAAASVALLSAATAASAQQVVFSTVVDDAIGGVAVDDDDAVLYDFATGTVTSVFAGLGGDLDAFYLFADNSFLGSSNFTASGGSTSYSDEQLYRVDGSGDSLFFDFASIGGSDVSAFDIADDGAYIFSDRSGGTIGGITVDDGDVVRYDPTTMTASILVAQADLFDDGDGEISAVDLLSDGRLVLSASLDETISGTAFNDGDLFIYDPSDDSATLLLSESVFDGGSNDIDAVFVIDINSIPEPTTAVLLGAGGLMLLGRRRRA